MMLRGETLLIALIVGILAFVKKKKKKSKSMQMTEAFTNDVIVVIYKQQ